MNDIKKHPTCASVFSFTCNEQSSCCVAACFQQSARFVSCGDTIFVLRRYMLPIACTCFLLLVLHAHATVAASIMVATFTQHSSLRHCRSTPHFRIIAAAFINVATLIIVSAFISMHQCRSLRYASCVSLNMPCPMCHACILHWLHCVLLILTFKTMLHLCSQTPKLV